MHKLEWRLGKMSKKEATTISTADETAWWYLNSVRNGRAIPNTAVDKEIKLIMCTWQHNKLS